MAQVDQPMSEEHKLKLQQHHVKLLESMEVSTIVDHLFSRFVLDRDMKDEIMSERVRV